MLTTLLAMMSLAAPPQVAPEVLSAYAAHELRYTGGDYQDAAFGYRLLAPEPLEAGRKYPLVVFLHGAGERGDDNQLQLLYLPTWMADADHRREFPCFLLAPQCPKNRWWTGKMRLAPPKDDDPQPPATELSHELQAVEQMIDSVVAAQPVDVDRVYLTGLSMGGFGSWQLAARRGERFAAVAPICGGGNPHDAARLAKLPLWVVHGDKDPVVPVSLSRTMVEAVRAAGGQVTYRELEGVMHDSWTPAYREPDGLLGWLFKQRRTK